MSPTVSLQAVYTHQQAAQFTFCLHLSTSRTSTPSPSHATTSRFSDYKLPTNRSDLEDLLCMIFLLPRGSVP
ncbi:unnamed protein product [Haemonchus placei]|uniref:Uncharacterized protein n=1 Tax=Haemonchus placei TaxID=6290 RepID=A0A3P7XFI5_HAEPC|nr:unnamed protein product [Haemonchus placei]